MNQTTTTVGSNAANTFSEDAASRLTRLLQQANALAQQGDVAQSERLCRRILDEKSDYADALHLLGTLCLQRGDAQRAVELIVQALTIDDNQPIAHANLGVAHEQLRRPQLALSSFDRALRLQPQFPFALVARANALLRCDRPREALESYERALQLGPNDVETLYNYASVLLSQDRPAEALTSLDRALQLQPNFALAHCNRGTALLTLKRVNEALASFDRALALQPDLALAHCNRATALRELGRPEQALIGYNQALLHTPTYVEAHYNRGNALRDLQRHEEALDSYDQAQLLRPNFPLALNNRGNALVDLGRFADALSSFERALYWQPGFTAALNNCGGTLLRLRRSEDAARYYAQLAECSPDYPYVLGNQMQAKLHGCDWQHLITGVQRISALVREGKPVITPLTLLTIADDPQLQRLCAQIYASCEHPASSPAISKGPSPHERIRVAYLSADFHEHATAYLTAGLFEQHDRKRFEIFAISSGMDDDGHMRRRLTGAFDQFINVRHHSDREVARLLREMEIDIVVDLKGYTLESRTGILALRPAPIQVSYLGYPGTSGAEWIDYIIADRFVIPEAQARHYSERIVYLPGCYQVNDSQRAVASVAPTRQQQGLREHGFVFCCFNHPGKILPAVFDVWMRLLGSLEGSQLWLYAADGMAISNLRGEAQRRGIAAARLVFAPHVAHEEHLARHACADLFLDTLPYNAHTTASDALWAGLPVLTCSGNAFAARVAGSLLHAVGLPELVTTNLDQYEQLAMKLATTPALLTDIQARLERRGSCDLFDTPRFCRQLETAYSRMWESYRRGEPKSTFSVDTDL